MPVAVCKPKRFQGYKLPEQQIAALRAEAVRTGLSMSEIVRRAIDAYLKRK